MESKLHSEWLLELMPGVDDMAARLKPKMIQDPFLDVQGRPFTYAGLCKYVCACHVMVVACGEFARTVMHVSNQ